jgi:hypothetical protein
VAWHAVPAQSQPGDCEAARCLVQSEIEADCPCDDATNHGRHVSCVARTIRRLWQQGDIPTNCKGKIQRCAARSTCGKEGAVTCLRPTSTCDPTLLTCASDPNVPCTTDLECGARCSLKRSADRCTEAGGTVGSSTTCCANCGP